jgi:molybdopterin molybdotransferase
MLSGISEPRDMLPVLLADALPAVRAQLSPVREREVVPLAAATRRILAGNLLAEMDLPAWNSSAVDGFAVRAADVQPEQVVTLRLAGEALAGHPFAGSVEAGQAARILTGAQLPSGADLVVMQETCIVDGETVRVPGGSGRNSNWRRRGEDVRAGMAILPAGHRLRPQDLALAGAVGYRTLAVFRQLRVGLLSTGDELCELGAEREDGQVWDTNRSLLRALLERMGCQVHDFGIVRDERREVEGKLSAAARESDLLVTSGGMSVGREDHVRSVIGRRGALDIWPLAIKTGRPVGLGDIDACPILALPGNPVAAVIAFAPSVEPSSTLSPVRPRSRCRRSRWPPRFPCRKPQAFASSCWRVPNAVRRART